ncbi:MAG: hypothetical protein NE334_02620 [Lentisphaeraceae bacterium]|nr:hypothetical protein [Lentisphaeraceae bacterium]
MKLCVFTLFFSLVFLTESFGQKAPVIHKQEVTQPILAKPKYLVPFSDPIFGSKITRVTGDPGTLMNGIDARWSNIARQNYPKNAAWNADQTLLFLQRHNGFPSFLFLDGKNYKTLFGRNSCPGDEVRWHPTLPDKMVYIKNNTLGFWNVRTDKTEVLASFEAYSKLLIGPWEGNLSDDGKLIVLCGNKGQQKVAFAYNIELKKKYPDIALKGVTIDWASISASGKYVVVNGHFNGPKNDQTQVFTLDGKKVGKLWESSRPSHYDLTVDINGDDVAVGGSKYKSDDGRVLKRRLKDGKITQLTKNGYAGHVSTRNVKRPGWAYVTYQYAGPNWGPYWDEVVAVKLDGSFTVERIAHLHSKRVDYLSEAHAVPSPDGNFVIWASNWRDKKNVIGAYIAERVSK